ncbi:MAG TPA: aldose epimerase family protein [Bradyrhizobium sp.]|uniref:aldose epimerase family protein n=1 Tax=Bradyrhizobium sp. TaxID=376 RepID=UPI002BFDEF03|nr:aldose epimerase family protein [Bradyrhizobium sp.]HLZ04466.1 aldose epimerase family protein [Bradyrhizobium sp.]
MAASKPGVERATFGRMPDGTLVERITLRGAEGFEAGVIPYGAVLHTLHVPDRAGKSEDIVLGHDGFDEYLAQRKFLGATIGRYANRIAGAQFTLDGATIKLDANNGPNMLHGGHEGFDRKLWRVVEVTEAPEPAVVLDYTSADGEGGFPGKLEARVIYCVTGPMQLAVTFEATTDRPTMVNLTNHSFFNLNGALSERQILDHRIQIVADHVLATDAASIPLPGPPHPVIETPFDFRQMHPIGARIRTDHEQLRRGRGYDHNYCLVPGEGVRLAARVESPHSGRVMELSTNQPGLQFYSGNFLDGTLSGKGGRLYRQSDAFCLEPQTWPDTPNRPDFPSARLDPGRLYRHETVYRFSIA